MLPPAASAADRADQADHGQHRHNGRPVKVISLIGTTRSRPRPLAIASPPTVHNATTPVPTASGS